MPSTNAAGSIGSIGAWLDIPSEADPASFLFCGADPAWTPARERYTSRPAPGSPQGRTVVPDSCPECGGRLAAESGDDPLGDSELVVHVCARCFRAEGKHAGRLTGDISDPNPDRPGRMAEKISGKGMPSLNAYLAPVLSATEAAKLSQPNGPARKKPAGLGRGGRHRSAKEWLG